ncbi:hypothetical protein [Mycobacterium paragordonae]|uniref:Uncharacterized protein n=1 Tax=Mycobacterium paragordonae TaxID=1389713 RepID=A0AAJ1S2X6_9MYCO|nr:hypothetical protein [Mycobacterium paragordonae]MDP7735134.1 hypothetical protein [Mycobacterium paragordonae]
MTVAHATPDVLSDLVISVETPLHVDSFHLEPRCRVCRNDELRGRVNDMLATGASYAMVSRSLATHNDRLDVHDRITIDSIRNHCQRHFPVQNVAKATYRDILERRARDNQIDFVEGVATALTPVAFLEVAMHKAFRTLVDDRTEVSVDTGLRAAEKLQMLMSTRDYDAEMADMRLWVGRIITAVKTSVPQSMWGAIIKELGLPEERAVLEDAGYFADEEPYDPAEFADEDDDDL